MFSDRFLHKDKTILQSNGMDAKLKNDLWNTMQRYFFDKVFYLSYSSKETYSSNQLSYCRNIQLIENFYEDFLFLPIRNLRNSSLNLIKINIDGYYKDFDWLRVYDMVEYVAKVLKSKDYEEEINIKLERNLSGFRMIGGDIVPITNQNEIDEVRSAEEVPFKSVGEHIGKAVNILSNREKADYENVIKESIMAVESMCSIIVGEKTTLGSALKKLKDNGVKIHGSLGEAFQKLYGYTSDANGIRHSGNIGGADSTFAEAKFMLIACSAFVNYLVENYHKQQ